MKSVIFAIMALLLFSIKANANALHLNPAQPSGKVNMKVYGQTSMPIGYYEFCLNYRERCGVKSDALAVVLTQQSWDLMVDTNTLVNAKIAPMTDDEIFGVPEKWVLPEVVGDCEDYALLKRKLLNEQGFPLGALLVTVGRDAQGGGHAVLTVVTNKGDYILDNQEEKILLWRDAEIYFLKRQAQDNPDQWMSLARS